MKERYIVGETRVSWLLSEYQDATTERHAFSIQKYPKRDGLPVGIFETRGEAERHMVDVTFRNDHAYRIGQEVGRLNDADKLRAIAKMIGYDAATKS